MGKCKSCCESSCACWIKLCAILVGTQEVPPVPTFGKGTAKICLDVKNGVIKYKVKVCQLSSPVTGGSFNLGTVGVVGPVLVGLNPFSNCGCSLKSEGIWYAIQPQVIAALLTEGVYINVTTVNHPTGEIRGQVITCKCC